MRIWFKMDNTYNEKTKLTTCRVWRQGKMDYRNKAIKCVKDTVLLEQKRQFEECGCNLDEQYNSLPPL